MAKVSIIFVHGDTFIDKSIDDITNGKYSHTAIKILGGVLEALGMPDDGDKYPGIHLHDLGKYDNKPYVEFVSVELPDLAAAENEARNMIGMFYSYIGCIEGGTYDLFGINLRPWFNKIINILITKFFHIPVNLSTGKWTMNCSETVTRILRAGGLNVLPGVDADCVTPMDLYRYLTAGAVKNKNSIKENDNMSEEATNTSTEAATTATNALKEAAITEIDNATTSGSTSVTTWVTSEITRLRSEIKATSSFTVAARDRIEIAALEAMSVVSLAELKNLSTKLKSKV
ncbi:hypothetical protein Ga0466249_001527 [Sporomusaceae bacterium BoRhaA]|uniref:hypothetical protein n=1 Tax=Pelorhabdus rhamnosifermentans TaxID=2772457 RepID=UPI001C06238C|nr:hypothetical protein [Pelorhabdus rhamnosifermentans]MBU2700435.1 hypothetical protein [Pelorhabdus rhamnosifermentans]